MTKKMLFFLLFLTHLLKADPIDAVEKWKAEKILNYLKDEKFIFNYCDCCSEDNLKVINIESVSIEPASEKLFSIRIKGKIVFDIETDIVGLSKKSSISNEIFNDVIPVNYTFVVKDGKGLTIDEVLNLGEWNNQSCQYFIDIPNPSIVSNSKYTEWYLKNVTNGNNLHTQIIGSWEVFSINNGKTEKIQGRFKFKPDNTYFTNMGEGTTGRFSIENNLLIMTNDDRKTSSKVPFYLNKNRLLLKTVNDDKLSLFYLLRE